MTHYSQDPGIVRAELFKRRRDGFQGKWYMTVALDMTGDYDAMTPVQAVQNAWDRRQFALYQHPPQDVLPPDGFFVVVNDPYHKAPYPVMIEV